MMLPIYLGFGLIIAPLRDPPMLSLGAVSATTAHQWDVRSRWLAGTRSG
jgi:hypothetical protein